MNIFTTQLSFLLFSPKATAYSQDPPSAKAGAHFDAKVAALAAFVDDARLFVRAANRARLRLSPGHRLEGLLHPSREVREVHYRLIQVSLAHLLVPFLFLGSDRWDFVAAGRRENPTRAVQPRRRSPQ